MWSTQRTVERDIPWYRIEKFYGIFRFILLFSIVPPQTIFIHSERNLKSLDMGISGDMLVKMFMEKN